MRLNPSQRTWLLLLVGLIIVGLARATTVGVPAKPLASPPATPAPPPAPAAPAPAAVATACSWVAVSIDNSLPARPQSGLLGASIVYEFPAEGGITRLLAFFCDGAPEVVGPVRSLRVYMIDLAREYNAVVAHSGQSESALEVINRGVDPVINEFRVPQPFRRDRRRRMPYNLYTSLPALRQYIHTAPAAPPPHWATADIPADNAGPMTVSIPYGPGYDVTFAYDPASGTYRRSVDRRPAIDAATGTRIAASSVIVQYVHWWQTYEGPILESRLDLIGTGRIAVFTGGERIEGRWARANAHLPTVFSDQDGRMLRLRPGLTWVTIVPDDRTLRVEPERPQGVQ